LKQFVIELPKFLPAIELLLLEFLLIYFLINYFKSFILFYASLYFLALVTLLFLVLCYLQLDLFALFMLMSELIIFFSTVLLIFSLNGQGEKNITKFDVLKTPMLVLPVTLCFGCFSFSEGEFYLPALFVDILV
jgi:hypothetical protein